MNNGVVKLDRQFVYGFCWPESEAMKFVNGLDAH